MTDQHSMVTLNDHFMVGSATSGHNFVMNMYGMYVRFEQILQTEDTNLQLSNSAFEHLYKPLVATSLGHQPVGDTATADIIIEGMDRGVVATDQLLKITRDYKDVLVHLWKGFEPDSTWEEFRDGPLGFELITSYEEDAAKFVYDMEIEFEELVSSPQSVLTSLVNHLLPRQDNPELDSFGQPKREISISCIDRVVDNCSVRELREGHSVGLLDSVGVHKQFLSSEQVDEIEEFIGNL
jgi:hypothetical protein|tara:strand:+ start:1072 stop:1785 length:714 start_codon:yes stop_codon:yes gene_type:complete